MYVAGFDGSPFVSNMGDKKAHFRMYFNYETAKSVSVGEPHKFKLTRMYNEKV